MGALLYKWRQCLGGRSGKSGAFLPILRPGPALSRPPPSRPVELVAFSRLIYTETSILANTGVKLIDCRDAFHGFNLIKDEFLCSDFHSWIHLACIVPVDDLTWYATLDKITPPLNSGGAHPPSLTFVTIVC